MKNIVELNNFDLPNRLILVKAYIDYARPDYKSMVDELITLHDLTCEKIAHLLPVAGASAISEWASGAVPNFENGERFIELWKVITGKTDIDIPKVPRMGGM